MFAINIHKDTYCEPIQAFSAFLVLFYASHELQKN